MRDPRSIIYEGKAPFCKTDIELIWITRDGVTRKYPATVRRVKLMNRAMGMRFESSFGYKSTGQR
jgi:hypothetical protein